MAPPINVQDWYGDRHTCQIASGALGYHQNRGTLGPRPAPLGRGVSVTHYKHAHILVIVRVF